MRGKVVLITGASSGVGRAAALALAAKGADLVLLCRDRSRAGAAAAEIRRQAPACHIQVLIADLRSQAQTRAAAAEFLATGRPLHVLINNAGLIQRHRSITEDGIETTFAVNHLAHFLLTGLLLDTMRGSTPGRIINVASRLHRRGRMHFDDVNLTDNYAALRAYSQSKLANILFTRALARRLDGSGITVNAMTPGLVASGFASNNPGLMRTAFRALSPVMRTPEKGAETLVYLSTASDVETTTGEYFADRQPKPVSTQGANVKDAQELWRISEKMTSQTAFSEWVSTT